jgi:membrane protein DedA with SNARE-associated domain
MNAAEPLWALDQYAFLILPALLVAEQFGIPLPAVPALLGFGALAAQGQGSIPLMLSTMATVALIVDFAWYEFGRRRGAPVLRVLCRLSPEPESCVRRAGAIFARYGARAMLVAKFVPGLTTVLPPLAGVFRIGRVRFAVYELAGVLLWAGTWIGVGYVFSDAVAEIATRVEKLGLWLVVVAALLGAYIVGKYLRRRLYQRRLRMATISPEARKKRLDAGEDVTIPDRRPPRDVAAEPHVFRSGNTLYGVANDHLTPIGE